MTELDPSAPWDPDPLEVGARVRLRLNGECRGTSPWVGRWEPHYPGYDGTQGVVSALHCPGGRCTDGHPYVVVFDGWLVAWGRYARSELERVHGAVQGEGDYGIVPRLTLAQPPKERA